MNKNKVVIMAIEGKYIVVYTDDGQFIKLPRKANHQVGQILYLDEIQPRVRKFTAGWQMTAVAAAVLLIFFIGMFYPFSGQMAEAYLSLGLNGGGAELWVARDTKVIKVKYSNSMTALDNLDIKGKDIYEAVTTITSQAQKLSLLNEDQENLLMVNLADFNEENHHIQETKLKEAIMNGLKTRNYHGVMVMDRHEKDFVDKAGELGLTASQFYVYEKGHAKGLPLTTDQLKHGHIKSVLHEAGTTPEELFGIKDIPQHTMNTNEKNTNENHNHMEQFTNWNKQHREAPAMPNNGSGQQSSDNMQNTQMPFHEENTFSGMTNPTPESGHNYEKQSGMQSDTGHGVMGKE